MTVLPNDIQDRHGRSAKVLSYALTLGDSDAWLGASTVWSVRLEREERAALGFAALASMPPDDAWDVAHAALSGHYSAPITPLIDFMDQAAHWADMSSQEELRAYALACYNRLPKPDQVAFLEHVQRRDAA